MSIPIPIRTFSRSLLALLGGLALAACGDAGEISQTSAGGATGDTVEHAELVEGPDSDAPGEAVRTDANSDLTAGPEEDGPSLAGLLKDGPGLSLAPTKSHSHDVRVLSLNIRVDRTDTNLQSFATRMPRIEKVIADYKPDIMGFQESEWDTRYRWKNAFSNDYHYYTVSRGGTWGSPDEGLALLVKKDRFNVEETNYKVFSQSARRDAGPCKWEPIQTKGNRITIRMKLRDRKTNEVIDVFNTHFPSAIDCEKIGMALLQKDYVKKFGNNVILMGDFNTGLSSGGTHSEGLKVTESFATETYLALHEDRPPGAHGHSYKTAEANETEKRIGTKIDHIFVGSDFTYSKAGIDRTVFLLGNPYNCDDDHARISSKLRIGCEYAPKAYFPVQDFDVYSDHWAIWTDVNRK